MLENKYISAKEYENAIKTKIETYSDSQSTNYDFLYLARNEAEKILSEKPLAKYQKITIETTFNPEIQNKVQNSIISDEYEVLYEGEWKEDVKEGIGVCEEKSISNKTVRRFEGMYENGMKNGFGTYKSSDGEYFEGFFKDNTMNGYGLFRKGDGDEYEGFFQNNKKEGKGVFTCKDGSVFKGMYRKDIKNGKGEIIYPNGNVFSGKWVNGKKQGIGKVKKANGGSVKYGEWDQGTRIKWLSEEEVKNYISI
jgi:hypothetical protein